MKHYVMGFVFNSQLNRVLLIHKRNPDWQAGRWNAFGGKIELADLSPYNAMLRESLEETGHNYPFKHRVTFTCPGGTVYVFAAMLNTEHIPFYQLEAEILHVWDIDSLPARIMANLKWLIPVCLSTIQFPLLVSDTTLGVNSAGGE